MSTQIIHDMPFSEYAAIDRANASRLLKLRESPLELLTYMSEPPPDKPEFALGHAAHAAVLEPLKYRRMFKVRPFDSYRTKASKAWREETKGLGFEPITEEQHQEAQAIGEAVRRSCSRYLEGGHSEVVLLWTDPETGVECKARIDYLGPYIVDVKTTVDATPGGFGRAAGRYGYHIRSAFYQRGVFEVTGEMKPVVLLAVKKGGSHDTVPYRVPQEALGAGRAFLDEKLPQYQRAMEHNEWPGIANGEELELELPPWELGTNDDPGLTIGGQPLSL